MHGEILEMFLLILIALGPVVLPVVLPESFGCSKDIQKNVVLLSKLVIGGKLAMTTQP